MNIDSSFIATLIIFIAITQPHLCGETSWSTGGKMHTQFHFPRVYLQFNKLSTSALVGRPPGVQEVNASISN